MRKSNSSSGAWAEVHGTLGDVTKGDPGKSAYEIAVEHGFEGTEEEWLAYVQANADRAVSASTAAQEAKEAARYASDEAQGFSESAGTSAGVAHTEAEAAAESAARAEAAAVSAGESRDGAAMSAVDAADSATAAAASATEAARQALLATGRADEARQSQIDAHVSEVHVEEMYIDIMRAPVVVEEQTRQAVASAQAAAQSATAAAGSATASASSATAAANSAGDSSDSATAAAASAQAAAQSASQTAAMLDTKLGKTETAVNSEKVNNLTVETAVPPNAVFTDTTYQQMTDQEAEDGIEINGKLISAHTLATFVLAVIADVINSAPQALDTLGELAAALGDDPNFATTVTNLISQKLDKSGGTIAGNLNVTGDVAVNGTITGDVTGNVTGNVTGSSGSCTGNAATATSAAACTGNAATATEFSTNKSVTLTGAVVGTASSKAGWSINTTLKSCYAVVESEAVENTYFKIGSGSIEGAYNSCSIIILIQGIVGNVGLGLWRILLSAGSTAGVFDAGSSTIAINSGLTPPSFIVAYKNNSGGSLQFEIYCNIEVRYTGYKFTILQEVARNNKVNGGIVTLSNGVTTNGQSAITSGFTALTTINATISGNISGNAATATKINGKTIPVVSSFDSSTGTLALTSLS